MKNHDISVIITAHNEGRLLHRTLKTAIKATERAKTQNISCEIILITDNPTKKTKKYLKNSTLLNKIDLIEEVDYKDAGPTRNYGISKANGKYISILDGDDLYAENWLASAFKHAEELNRPTILHPETAIFFGEYNFIWKRRNSTDPDFRKINLMHTNYWDSLAFADKKIFKKVPYSPTQAEDGLIFEDWHWNCETLANGFDHVVVPTTYIAVRRKFSGSRLSTRSRSGYYVPNTFQRSSLFDQEIKNISKAQVEKYKPSPKAQERVKTSLDGTIFYKVGSYLKRSIDTRSSSQAKKWEMDNMLMNHFMEFKKVEPWLKQIDLSEYRVYPEKPQLNADADRLVYAYKKLFIDNEDTNDDMYFTLDGISNEYINSLCKRFLLSKQQLLTVIERFILQVNSKNIHFSADSPIKHIVEKYRNPTASGKRFYLHLYDSSPVDYKSEQIFDIVDMIFVNSEKIKNNLINNYGIDEEKIKLVDTKSKE